MTQDKPLTEGMSRMNTGMDHKLYGPYFNVNDVQSAKRLLKIMISEKRKNISLKMDNDMVEKGLTDDFLIGKNEAYNDIIDDIDICFNIPDGDKDAAYKDLKCAFCGEGITQQNQHNVK